MGFRKLLKAVHAFKMSPKEFKSMKSPGAIKDSATTLSDNAKKVVQQAQEFDPGSKYGGVSGIKGVESSKTRNKRLGAADEAAVTAEAAAAAAAEEEKAFETQRESQRKGLMRKGRRASILTSSQGVEDQLGILG